MGRAMVGNLVIAGAQLTVWNRTPGVVTPSASLRVAERAGAVAAASEIVIINASDTLAKDDRSRLGRSRPQRADQAVRGDRTRAGRGRRRLWIKKHPAGGGAGFERS